MCIRDRDYVVNNKTINPIDIKVEEWPAYMEYNNLEEVFRRKEKEALLRGVGLAEQVGSSTEIIVAAALGGPKWWVMDSGSSKDLVSVEFLPKEVVITPADDPAALSTANGPVIADEEAELKLEMLEEDIKPLIMEHAPPILSMGERIMDRHCCNWWPDGMNPIILTANGLLIELDLDHKVLILREDSRLHDKLPHKIRTYVYSDE